jgi:hypothetical protein
LLFSNGAVKSPNVQGAHPIDLSDELKLHLPSSFALRSQILKEFSGMPKVVFVFADEI